MVGGGRVCNGVFTLRFWREGGFPGLIFLGSKTRGDTITRRFVLRERSPLRRSGLLNLIPIPTCVGCLSAMVVFLSSRRFQRYYVGRGLKRVGLSQLPFGTPNCDDTCITGASCQMLARVNLPNASLLSGAPCSIRICRFLRPSSP